MPPPTDADLSAERVGGVMVAVLGEEADWVVALGHIHPADMAQSATKRLRDLVGDQTLDAFHKWDVQHVHGQRRESLSSSHDWAIWWEIDGKPIQHGAPQVFPMTIVAAQ